MANCCYTEIDIFSENIEKLDILEAKIDEWIEGDWEAKWLGNILIGAGVLTKEEIEAGKSPYRCRGSLIFMERYGEEQLHLTTETAWVPMMTMWPAVCEKMGLDDARITFIGEENGCEVYVTNEELYIDSPYIFDGYFEGEDEYMVSFFDPDNADMHGGYVEENQVDEKRLKEVLENAKKEIPELTSLDLLHQHMKNGNSYFNLHKFRKAEISEFA